MAKVLDGVDCVVHLAARAHRRAEVQEREADLYRATNVVATHRLAEAAAAVGVKRFIFLSSIAVHGAHTTGRAPFRVDDICAPSTVYGATKYAAEQVLQAVQRTSPRLTVDIIRCPAVIGPDAPGNMAVLGWMVDRRFPMPFGSVRNRRAFLAIDDLISFIAQRCVAETSGLNTFALASQDTISTPDLIKRIAEAKQSSALLLPFPVPMLRRMLSAANRRDKADALTEDLEVDTSAARATGWKPAVPIRVAVQTAYARARPHPKVSR